MTADLGIHNLQLRYCDNHCGSSDQSSGFGAWKGSTVLHPLLLEKILSDNIFLLWNGVGLMTILYVS